MPNVADIIAMGIPPTVPLMSPLDVAETKYKIQEIKDAQASQNALKALMSNPQNIDPTTGTLNQNALSFYTSHFPQQGMAMQEESAKIVDERARAAERQDAAWIKDQDFLERTVREPALNAFRQALQDGKDREAALAAGQAEYSKGLEAVRSAGFHSREQLDSMNPQFDPDRITRNSMMFKARVAGKDKTVLGVGPGGQYGTIDTATNQFTPFAEGVKPLAAQMAEKREKSGLTEDAKRYYAKEFQTYGPSALGRLPKQERDEVINYAAGGGDAESDIRTQAAQKGSAAEQRAEGTRRGQLRLAEHEMQGAVALSQAAYDKLPRGQFVPFNQLANLVERQTSSPEQAAAYAADNAIVNIYARMISPTGQGTDSDKAHAREMLNQAQGPDAHRAVLNQLMAEGRNALTKAEEAAAETTAQTPIAKSKAGGRLPAGLPSAEGLADGQQARENGKVVAVVRDGKWTLP